MGFEALTTVIEKYYLLGCTGNAMYSVENQPTFGGTPPFSGSENEPGKK
jgi:hypothetical protein